MGLFGLESLSSLKIAPFDRAHTSISVPQYLCSYLPPFSDIARYWWKIADLNLPHPFGVTPLEFRREFWQKKTRITRLSSGVICVILRSAILVQCWFVTDRRTDGHTTTAYTAPA